MNLEQLANWFFRLNGCLTMTNFIVHDESTASQRTDIDILAVRFPYRREKAGPKPLSDHEAFQNLTKTGFLIAEIKAGTCRLNGPWTDPDKGNLARVLSAIGIVKKDVINSVADALYENSYYEDDQLIIRLFTLGRRRNDSLAEKVVQITWSEIADFFFYRFKEHNYYKRQHEHWDECGKKLFEIWSDNSSCQEDFKNKLLRLFDVSGQ
jgi:hypothetical protein